MFFYVFVCIYHVEEAWDFYLKCLLFQCRLGFQFHNLVSPWLLVLRFLTSFCVSVLDFFFLFRVMRCCCRHFDCILSRPFVLKVLCFHVVFMGHRTANGF